MLINIDPHELGAVAATLRSCALEVADIGSQLASCAGCAMPAVLDDAVNQMVGRADRGLDATAIDFTTLANDLSNRAGIAANDSLTVGANPNLDAPVLAPSTAIVGGGWGTSAVTILSPDGSPANLSGSSIVGGNVTLDASMGIDLASFGLGAGIVGGTPTYSGMAGATMALAQAAENSRQRGQKIANSIMSNPGSSMLAQKMAMNAQSSFAYDLNHFMADSKTKLEEKHGPLTDSTISSMSPYTPPNSISVFDGISGLDMFALSLQGG